jgi:hypothetical protein
MLAVTEDPVVALSSRRAPQHERKGRRGCWLGCGWRQTTLTTREDCQKEKRPQTGQGTRREQEQRGRAADSGWSPSQRSRCAPFHEVQVHYHAPSNHDGAPVGAMRLDRRGPGPIRRSGASLLAVFIFPPPPMAPSIFVVVGKPDHCQQDCTPSRRPSHGLWPVTCVLPQRIEKHLAAEGHAVPCSSRTISGRPFRAHQDPSPPAHDQREPRNPASPRKIWGSGHV